MSLNLDKSGWTRTKFGTVVRNVNVTMKDPTSAGIDRLIAMEHLDPGELMIRRWGDLADGTTFTRRVKPGQTLFGKRRAYQRKVAYAEFDAICSGDILAFETDPTMLLPEFLPFIVQSDGFFDHALGTSAGSLSPRTNWRDLSNYEFLLPPLDMQKLIADLLWAVELHRGALTETEERARATRDVVVNEFGGKAPNHCPVSRFRLPLEQPVQVGPFGGTLASKHLTESGVRVLKIQNITSTHKLSLEYSVFVPPHYAATLDRYRIQVGDTVIVAQGATVGKTALIDTSLGDAVISQHLIRVRLDPERILPRFCSLMIQSGDFQRQIDKMRRKTTRDGLNTSDVAGFLIPDVDLHVQAQLVTTVDRVERSLTSVGLERAALGAVRSSLLEAIFGGA